MSSPQDPSPRSEFVNIRLMMINKKIATVEYGTSWKDPTSTRTVINMEQSGEHIALIEYYSHKFAPLLLGV